MRLYIICLIINVENADRILTKLIIKFKIPYVYFEWFLMILLKFVFSLIRYEIRSWKKEVMWINQITFYFDVINGEVED